jgi:hypothetical protein
VSYCSHKADLIIRLACAHLGAGTWLIPAVCYQQLVRKRCIPRDNGSEGRASVWSPSSSWLLSRNGHRTAFGSGAVIGYNPLKPKIDGYRCPWWFLSCARLVVASVEPGVDAMQCVICWNFGAKTTMGFCFRVVAAGAIVFAIALFFADSPN